MRIFQIIDSALKPLWAGSISVQGLLRFGRSHVSALGCLSGWRRVVIPHVGFLVHSILYHLQGAASKTPVAR